jgi:hypothetical protein
MRQLRIRLTMLITSDPRKAALNPSTWKPRRRLSESQEVRLSIMALMMNVKSPRVRMRRGKVKSFTNGLITVLISPKIMLTIRIPHHSPE